jgi:hypothetical protein
MFHRWLQENDFKYMEKHFGINQITSYASHSYEELAPPLLPDGSGRTIRFELGKREGIELATQNPPFTLN